jgi:RNA polymerase sigma-70 factor (ECF subfamily)
MVKYYLHTARAKMIDIFDKRCALINKEGICHQCSELNGIFNPKQNFEVEKNKIEMARLAEKGEKDQLLELRLQIMREIDPFESKGADLQIHHLEHNRKVMENIFKKDEE